MRCLSAMVVLASVVTLACGGDGGGGDDGPAGDVATLDAEAPTPQQLEGCLRTNGFSPELDTSDPAYGVGTIETTIEVPGFAVPGGGTVHVFATVEEAETAFPDLVEGAFNMIERHRNAIIDELVTGTLGEEGAEEVRRRFEACIGPMDESGGEFGG